MPRRPARPVSWVYSPAVTSACVSPFHLLSRSRTTERAGMLMPSASVSVANTTWTRPADEELLDDLLEGRQHPRVVRGDPATETLEPLVIAQDAEVLLGDVGAALVDVRHDLIPLLRRGEPQPGPQALHDRGVAAGAAEDEDDPREQPGTVEPLDDVHSRGRVMAALAMAAPLRSSIALRENRCSSRAIRMSSGLTTFCSSSTNRSYSRVPTITCCHSGTGRCSSTMTAVSPRTSPSHSPNSSALLTVADSETRRTTSGRWRMTSSQTAPRIRSER